MYKRLTAALIEQLGEEHLAHCLKTHGQAILVPMCVECVDFAERTLDLANTTPETMLEKVKRGTVADNFLEILEAVKQRRAGASLWD